MAKRDDSRNPLMLVGADSSCLLRLSNDENFAFSPEECKKKEGRKAKGKVTGLEAKWG
jgi:hypothetical protein